MPAPVLPWAIANGTVADGDKVQANFAAIVAWLASIPGGNIAIGSIPGNALIPGYVWTILEWGIAIPDQGYAFPFGTLALADLTAWSSNLDSIYIPPTMTDLKVFRVEYVSKYKNFDVGASVRLYDSTAGVLATTQMQIAAATGGQNLAAPVTLSAGATISLRAHGLGAAGMVPPFDVAYRAWCYHSIKAAP